MSGKLTFRALAIAALATIITSCQSGSSVDKPLAEQNIQGQDEVTIPHEKFTLENGLTVILHDDNSDPLVHVDVTYHVGSAREEVGKSGFAHFFEHMMFQGSKHVDDEQH